MDCDEQKWFILITKLAFTLDIIIFLNDLVYWQKLWNLCYSQCWNPRVHLRRDSTTWSWRECSTSLLLIPTLPGKSLMISLTLKTVEFELLKPSSYLDIFTGNVRIKRSWNNLIILSGGFQWLAKISSYKPNIPCIHYKIWILCVTISNMTRAK